MITKRLKLSDSPCFPPGTLAPNLGHRKLVNKFPWLRAGGLWHSAAVGFLTRQQQLVLCAIVLLLLTGRAVKSWRTAHPPVESKPGWVLK